MFPTSRSVIVIILSSKFCDWESSVLPSNCMVLLRSTLNPAWVTAFITYPIRIPIKAKLYFISIAP